MKTTSVTYICDLCHREERFDGVVSAPGWRELLVKFNGALYSEYEGDVCPECVTKIREQFGCLRPGRKAATLLESAGQTALPGPA